MFQPHHHRRREAYRGRRDGNAWQRSVNGQRAADRRVRARCRQWSQRRARRAELAARRTGPGCWCAMPPNTAAGACLHDAAAVHHQTCAVSLPAITPRSWRRSASAPAPRLGDEVGDQVEDPALIVTSSAVVGSSAISRSGPQASAIAIVTAGAGRPRAGADTRRRGAPRRQADAGSRRDRALARPASGSPGAAASARRPGGRCCAAGSAPSSAPWKTIPMRLPRSRQSSASLRPTSSSPSKRMLPVTSARSGRPSSASAVIDLPQPDSPIRPSVSPRRKAKQSRRARRRPGRVGWPGAREGRRLRGGHGAREVNRRAASPTAHMPCPHSGVGSTVHTSRHPATQGRRAMFGPITIPFGAKMLSTPSS